MAVSLVLLAAVIAAVNGRPELTDGAEAQELVLQANMTETRCYMDLELWIDGVVFKRTSELEAYGLMVEMTYKNGSLKGCKMVPLGTDENFAARQEAKERCVESFGSSDKESQDEVLVLSVTERITDRWSLIPLHQRLEGFTYVGNTLYHISPGTMSWHNAAKYCDQLGVTLAFIETRSETNHLKGSFSIEVWIGLNDIVAEGIFVNVWNTPITYSNWKQREPNNDGGEDCVSLRGWDHLLWNDVDCNAKRHALCEHPPVEKPQEQYQCPQGYWQHEASCYIRSRSADTYSQGEAFCSSNGAYPVFINSLGEHNFLAGKLTESAFIGYTDGEVEGVFISSQFGVPLFERWYTNEPSNTGGKEDCVEMASDFQHFWNDVPCEKKFKMLCEKAAGIRAEAVMPAK